MTLHNIPGSRWWKFDFHTHTPIGSDDYKGDKAVSARDWLTHYRDAGLDCVVVTDHNSGAWVDEVKAVLVRPQAALSMTVDGAGAGALGGLYRYDWIPNHLVAIRASSKT